jgi:hypothetical protein
VVSTVSEQLLAHGDGRGDGDSERRSRYDLLPRRETLAVFHL